MKKLLGVLLALVMSTAAYADYSFLEGLKYGVEVGANTATIVDVKGGSDGHNKAGYTFGGYAEKTLSDKLTTKFGLSYVTKGAHLYELTFLEVPLELQYFITDKFYVAGGTYLGFDVSDYKKGESTANKVDFGASLGLGYKCGKMALELQYARSLTNALDRSDGSTGIDDTGRHEVYTLALSYELGTL